MSISFSGLASGLDTSSWVKSLTQLRQAKVTTLETQKATLATAQTTLQGIRSFFSSFRASLEKITDSKFNVSSMDIFSKKLAAVSNAAILSATAKSNAAEGSYEVKVNNTATQTQVKSGYRYKTTLVSTTQATTSSYLKNVGVGYGTEPESGIKAGNIEITHNDVTSTISISANETMNSFLDKLHAVGINAEFDNNTGIFSIDVNVGDINDVDNTNILSKLKISDINYGYSCEQLHQEEEEIIYHQATVDTLLSDLGVNAGDVYIKTGLGEYQVTLEANETIGSLVTALVDAGIEASFNDGVFSINNAYIYDDTTTGLIEHFGLTNPVSQTQQSDGLVYQTITSSTTTAALDSLIADINGVTLEGDETIIVQNASGETSTITIGTDTTIGDMVNAFNNGEVGLHATFTNGILSIDNGFIIGGTFDIEGAFGLEYTGEMQTVTGSSLTVTTTTITGATGDTQLKNLSTAVTSGTIKVTDTTDVVHNLVIDENSTIGDFVNSIRALGLGANFNDATGVLTLTGGSYTIEGVPEGSASNILNVFFNQDTLTPSAIDSATAVSEALNVSIITTTNATGTTTLSELGMAEGTYNATFRTGETEVTVTINGSTTLDGLASLLRTGGVDAEFDNALHSLVLTDATFLGVTGGNFDTIMNFSSTITGRNAVSDTITGAGTTTGRNMTSSGAVMHDVETSETITTSVTTTTPIASSSDELTYTTTETVSGTTTGVDIIGAALNYNEVTTTGATQTSGTITYVSGTNTVTVGQTATGTVLSGVTTTAISQTSGVLATEEVTPGEEPITTTVGATSTSETIYTNATTVAAAQSSTITYSTTNVVPESTVGIVGTQSTDPITWVTTELVGGTTTTIAATQTSTIPPIITTEVTGGTTTGISTTLVSDTLYYYSVSAAATTTYAIGTRGDQVTYEYTGTYGLSQSSNTFTVQGTTVYGTTTTGNVAYATASAYKNRLLSSTDNLATYIGESISGSATLSDGSVIHLTTGNNGSKEFISCQNISDIVAALQNAGVANVSFNDSTHQMTVNSNNPSDISIVAVSGQLMAAFFNEGINTSYYGGGHNATAIDTLASAGYDYNYDAEIRFNNNTATITVSATTTFGELVQALNDHDIQASFVNGQIHIEDSKGYIRYISPSLNTFLGIDAGSGISYTSGTVELNMTESTTLSALGMSSFNSRFGTNDGHYYTFTTSNTVGDVRDTLKSLGYECDLTNGVLSFDPTNGMSTNNIITSMNTNLRNALGLQDSTFNVTGYTNSTCSSDELVLSYTLATSVTATTSLENMGYDSNFVVYDNNGNSLAISKTSSLLEVYTALSTFTNGGITITANGVDLNDPMAPSDFNTFNISFAAGSTTAIVNIDGALNGTCLLDPTQFGYGKSYEYTDNTTSTLRMATGATKISDLGGAMSAADRVITYNGGSYTCAINATINSVISALSSYAGVSASISNGVLSITGDSTHYIKDLGAGLKAIFGGTIQDVGEGVTYNITGGNYVTTTVSVTGGTTTFAELGLSDEDIWVVDNLGNTITASASTYIEELYLMLNPNGIYISKAGLERGIVRVGNSGDTNWITDMSSALANALGIQAGDGYSYNVNYSGGSTQTVTHTAQSTTTLGELGLTSDAHITTDLGTITITSSDTIGSLVAKLTNPSIGITASMNDTTGVLTIGGAGNEHYITSIDSPQLLSILSGITVGEGHTYSVQESYTETVTATGSEIWAMQLSEFGLNHNAIVEFSNGNRIIIGSDATVAHAFDKIREAEPISLNSVQSLVPPGLTITVGDPSDSVWITDIDSDLASILGIGSGDGSSYNVSGNNTITGSTTLEELGFTGNSFTITTNLGTESFATANYGDIDGLLEALNDYCSLNASIEDGVISILPTNRGATYLIDMTPELASALHIQVGEGHTYNVDVTPGTDPVTTAVTATSSTTFADLGLSGTATINTANSSPIVINIDGGATVGDLVSALNSSGIYATLNSDGTLVIGDSGDTNQITGISGPLSSLLHIYSGQGNSYSVDGGILSADATLGERGMTVDGTITTDTGVYTFTSSSTIQDVLDTLNDDAGLDASFVNGRFSIAPQDGHYVSNMTSNIAAALGFAPGDIGPYGSYYTETGDSITTTVSGTTTLSQLGLRSGNQQIVFGDGTTANGIDGTYTVDDIIDILGDHGVTASVSNGQFSLGDSGDTNYVSNMSLSLRVALGIDTGEGYTYDSGTISHDATGSTTLSTLGLAAGNYNIVTNTGTITVTETSTIDSVVSALTSAGFDNVSLNNTTHALNIGTTEGHYIESIDSALASVLKINAPYSTTTADSTNVTTHTAEATTNLATLGMVGASGTIITDNGNVAISSSDTLQTVIDKLGSVNITATLTDGVFTIGDAGDSNFVRNMSQNLQSVFNNLSVGEGFTYNLGSGSTVQTTTTTTTEAVTGACTFGELGISNGVINISNGETVTVSSGTTISDFMTDMAGKGISVYLTNGYFSLEPQGNNYIESVTGDNILGAMNLVGSTYSVSAGTLGTTKLKYLKDSLGNNLGISSGLIKAYKNGISSNIFIDNESTLDELASQLSSYNIQMVYSSGTNGKIYFTGSGNSYLSEVAEGSNLMTQLGISDWAQVENTASQELSYTSGSNEVITGNTKLVDLKDSEGNSIGITTGKYKIVAGGINYEGSISAATTVNDLFSQLSLYGISGSINSEGQITLNTSNDDTYLVNSGGAAGYSNLVEELFPSWTMGNIYTSRSMAESNVSTVDMTSTTKLKDIDQGTYQAGKIVVSRMGEEDSIIELSENATVGDFMSAIAYYGFNSYVENGRLVVRNDGYTTMHEYTDTPSESSNVLSLLGLDTDPWESPGNYTGDAQSATTYSTNLVAATRNTQLSELRSTDGTSLGITTGEFIVHSNGVQHTVNLTSTDITLDQFINTLSNYGINAVLNTDATNSILKIVGSGDTYLTSSEAPGASNVVEKLFGNNAPSSLYDYSKYEETSETVTHTVIATLSTALSDYDNGTIKSEGTLALSVGGNQSQINITSYDTFGSLIEKFERAGVHASLVDGVLKLESGNQLFEIDTENSTSNLLDNLGLLFSNNLGGFAASNDSVTQTTTTIEDRTLSVAKYADYDTQMGLLNISSGTLSVYRNGAKKLITIDNTETFSQFRTRIQDALGDVDIDFMNGKLRFFSTNEGVDVQVGSSNDTSNISSICGFSQDENGYIISARELYKVNASSLITAEGLFRYGDVTEGTFIIGDATFNITSETTIQNIVAQINSSDKANASAYWDSVDGKLVISSRSTGASMVNIEAGTSNFTDILGLTTSEWDGAGNPTITRIRLDSQELGQNARFTINGTSFQSASNVITSDVSRIQGLTLNLKSSSMGDTVTVTVSKDSEAVSEAVGEFVDAYNELVENVDAELKSSGALKDQSTLKFIRQQIRNLLVNTFAGATTFRNLAALGISTSAGNTVGIDTSNSGVEYLYFDSEKFLEGYNKDAEAVKNMLVGSDETPGILIQVENIVENALATGTGYFSIADKSYSDKITSINEKIKKANLAIEAYRARLESKFQSMDLLISQMQNQYNSFLSGNKTT